MKLPISTNSAALWGFITVIVLYLLIHIVRKRRNERRWKKYGEDQIYRPDEWERKQSSGIVREESLSNAGNSEATELRSNVRRKGLPFKFGKFKQSNSTGDKKPDKTSERISVAIPDIEQIY